MKALSFSLFFSLFFTVATAQSQQPAPSASPAPAPLTQQFNKLKGSANSYRERDVEYKVVSTTALDAFWKSVQQTIKDTEQGLINGQKSAQQELVQARLTIEEQQRQLEALKLENAEKEKQVQQSENDVNNLSVLGINMQKQLYVVLTAVIILALLIVLAVMLLQYKSSKKIAVEKQQGYQTIEQELAEHKKNARERELKLKRELQTEMNRTEELILELDRARKQH